MILDNWLGTGVLTLTWEETTETAHIGVQKALQLAKSHGAHFTLLHGPLALRTGALEALWYPVPAAQVLHERIKEALDPENILNPGRFVCGI